MSKELDRKTRPWFYLISFSMMIAGFIFHFNAWLIGGGLVIFMLIVFEDVKDVKDEKHKAKVDLIDGEEPFDEENRDIDTATLDMRDYYGLTEVKHESRDRGTDESSKDQMPRM